MPRNTALNGLLVVAIGVGSVVICTPAFLAPAPPSHGSENRIVLTAPEVVGRSAAGKAPSKVKPANGFWRKASSDAESTSFGFFARTAAVAACAFVASAVNRRKQQQRTSSVAMRWFPSACGEPRQKIMRRLDRYGGVPAWSRKPLIKRRLKQPWKKRVTRRLSEYGHCKMETQRVRFHYNVKAKQMEGYFRKACSPGLNDPMETFMKTLESRFDNTVWRLGLAPTMAAARQFVRGGHFQYRAEIQTGPGARRSKWRSCNIPSLRLKVGTHIRVNPSPSSRKLAKKTMDEDGPVVKPSHLEWDADKMKGRYLDTCDIDEIGLKVDENMIYRIYTGIRGLKKNHLRFKEGTTQLVNYKFRGGKPADTPENIINMKRGKGLRQTGRRRPPCLWGNRRTKRPLNSPWESKKSLSGF